MDHKKDLKQLYKDIKIEAGIFQVKNIKNQKIFIKTSMNLKTINGLQFQLEHGSCPNKILQQEWTELGKDSFVFEVLEVIKPKEGEYFNGKNALKKLEEKWLHQLQPFGERGYHTIKGRNE